MLALQQDNIITRKSYVEDTLNFFFCPNVIHFPIEDTFKRTNVSQFINL